MPTYSHHGRTFSIHRRYTIAPPLPEASKGAIFKHGKGNLSDITYRLEFLPAKPDGDYLVDTKAGNIVAIPTRKGSYENYTVQLLGMDTSGNTAQV